MSWRIPGFNIFLQATNPNVQDENGSTALHLSVSQEDENFAKLLLQHPELDVTMKRSGDSNTPMHIASQNGNEAIVQLILRNKQPDLTILGGRGWTALQLAVMNNRESVVRLLLRAIVGTATASGSNVLESVINTQHATQGRSALHLATRLGNVSIVNLLLQHKADTSLQDCHGLTPLHVAVSKNDVNIVDLLLMQGANVHIQNRKGKTAVDMAKTKKHDSILQLLRCS